MVHKIYEHHRGIRMHGCTSQAASKCNDDDAITFWLPRFIGGGGNGGGSTLLTFQRCENRRPPYIGLIDAHRDISWRIPFSFLRPKAAAAGDDRFSPELMDPPSFSFW